ncbi:hypothetical protein GA0070616_4590 [Micromonospora nigra]|uniref:Uncharacterized protein n=1 Tax=Micromonospora nigra TaxID=145857 RepID=A0A1C6SUJ5_9ACTN|nr:hypothetical protein [Micromonospora nigra]SCL32923.1 hypothetical protein GA0070616_4590 [Micromonospora nigra]
MSSHTRAYVAPNGAMYRAAAYDAAGNCVRSVGPYTTKGAAARQRPRPPRGGFVRVEVCQPVWNVVPGTQVEA